VWENTAPHNNNVHSNITSILHLDPDFFQKHICVYIRAMTTDTKFTSDPSVVRFWTNEISLWVGLPNTTEIEAITRFA